MPVLPYGAIYGFDCERVVIILPTIVYEEGEYPEVIVAHHVDGLSATPVRLGIEYVPKDSDKAENAKLRALVRDYANAPCQCHRNGVACRYLDGGACTLYDRAISLGVEVD